MISSCLMTSLKGKCLSKAERDLLSSRKIAGAVLFRRNLESFRQIYELCREIKSLSDPPPLLGIDMEGGPVNRLSRVKGALPWPSAEALGKTAPEGIFQLAKALGRELSALGFDINFAPVADLPSTSKESGMLKGRTFSRSADIAERAAGAFAEGVFEGGAAPCLKHFPGHGGVEGDSHKTLPADPRSLEELAPQMRIFCGILRRRPFPVMTAHVEFPGIESGPATFSKRLLRGELRGRMGFEGLIVSDDIDMAALEKWPPGERVFRALRGGCELILCCQREETPFEAIEFFERQPEKAEEAQAFLQAAAQKIAGLKSQRASIPQKSWRQARRIISCPAHEEIFRAFGFL